MRPSPRPASVHRRQSRLILALAFCALPLVGLVCHEPAGFQTFASPQADPIALSPDGTRLYVAMTTANQLQVIDTATHTLIAQVPVGMEPVSVAVRPDGNQVWVANHVSDSVSVVDTNPASIYLHQVIETIQSFDGSRVTDFDEPVGIAFASNSKAYVALSSRDQVAIVDGTTYQVTGTIDINAQDPRALRVRNGRLYVLPFESGNKTELSTCPSQVFPINPVPGSQCTFDQADHNFATNPQLIGAVVDLVVDPDVPDRDLYVYDTATDAQLDVVSGVGTLLYGLVVSSTDEVFVSMTDARNAVNGQAGTSGQGLADLENRMFLNQLGKVDCSGASCGTPLAIDLEEAPGTTVTTPLATPYGIALSDDDSTLVVTAASSSRIFSFDTGATGMGGVLDTLDVGAIPRGVALRSDDTTGEAQTAYILNTLGNSVSVVDVSTPSSMSLTTTIALPGDPTPTAIRLGQIAFNDANASTSGTFSCESCHPDAHTDQLLWVIGAQCTFGGCNQEEVRSTMPVRGLRDTLPLHWDGVLGDPFGGSNGEIQSGLLSGESEPPNCGPNGGGGNCFRHLVDAAVAGVMCDTSSCPTNINEMGLAGGLLEAERDNMSAFLENVSYPPARSRRPDDVLTAQAANGFEDFFFDQGGIGIGPQTCADAVGGCHALPWTAGTSSTFVGGFDAPTMRGITDRWLQFSVGVTNVEDQLVLSLVGDLMDPPYWTPAVGFDELMNWKLAFGSATNPGAFRDVYNVGPFDIFQMIEEMSTGYPGVQGRQVTLNLRTTGPGEIAATEDILDEIEAADIAGVVNLRGFGLRMNGGPCLNVTSVPVAFENGTYDVDGTEYTRAQLIADVQAAITMITLTADLRQNAGQPGFEPPAISVPSVGSALFGGRLDLPQLPGDNPMNIRGVNIHQSSQILVDGVVVSGSIACTTGSFSPTCPAAMELPNQRNLNVTLSVVPPSGTHFLQIQSPAGLLSNELPFTVQ